MIAQRLIVNPNKATLAELIDAHNMLVRHLFPSEHTEVTKVSRFDDEKPSGFTLADIQAANRLLLLWGYRCMCVFPVPNELRPDVRHCIVCKKPYEEPLEG